MSQHSKKLRGLQALASDLHIWDTSHLGRTISALQDLQPPTGTKLDAARALRMREVMLHGMEGIRALRRQAEECKDELSRRLEQRIAAAQQQQHSAAAAAAAAAAATALPPALPNAYAATPPSRAGTPQLAPPASHSKSHHKRKRDSGGGGGGTGGGGKGSKKGGAGKFRMPAWAHRVPQQTDRCAARVTPERDLWILVLVVSGDAAADAFTVVDDDDEADLRYYTLARGSLMALAREGESSGDHFPVDSECLAMYPNTTSFYRALIVAPPQRAAAAGAAAAAADLCVVQFEDDEDEATGMPRRHLVPVRFVCYRPEHVLK